MRIVAERRIKFIRILAMTSWGSIFLAALLAGLLIAAMMHHYAAKPIYVNSKHWGAFILGIRPEVFIED